MISRGRGGGASTIFKKKRGWDSTTMISLPKVDKVEQSKCTMTSHFKEERWGQY